MITTDYFVHSISVHEMFRHATFDSGTRVAVKAEVARIECVPADPDKGHGVIMVTADEPAEIQEALAWPEGQKVRLTLAKVEA